MFRNLMIMAAMTAMASAFLVASGARAQDDSEFDPCAGLRGQAHGLCTAYTKGMKCGSDDQRASDEACGTVATNFEEVTGYPPPSNCPCDFSLERIRDLREGWVEKAFRCTENSGFRSIPPPPFGENMTTLEQAPTIPGEYKDRAIVRIFAAAVPTDTRARLSCQYWNKLFGLIDNHFEDVFASNKEYEAIIREMLADYYACKGAIGVLAAALYLEQSSCVFD